MIEKKQIVALEKEQFCILHLSGVNAIVQLLSSEGTVFLYLTRQHYWKTVLKGEDNNMFSTEQLILDIKQ